MGAVGAGANASDCSGYGDAPGGFFLQKLELRPIHMRVDFLPKRLSYADLLAPSAVGVAQLLPVHNVSITLGRLRLGGQTTWAALGRDVLAEWLPQLMAQWHRYVGSISPLASVVNVSSAASQLLLAPLRHAPLRGLSLGGDAFARAVGVEALSLAARLVGLLHVLLEQIDSVPPVAASPHYPQATVRAAVSHLAFASDATMNLRDQIDKRPSSKQ